MRFIDSDRMFADFFDVDGKKQGQTVLKMIKDQWLKTKSS